MGGGIVMLEVMYGTKQTNMNQYGIQRSLKPTLLLPGIRGEGRRTGESGPDPGSREDRSHGGQQATGTHMGGLTWGCA